MLKDWLLSSFVTLLQLLTTVSLVVVGIAIVEFSVFVY